MGGADGAAGEAQFFAGDLRLRLVPLVVADPAPLAIVVDLHVSLQREHAVFFIRGNGKIQLVLPLKKIWIFN